MSKFVFGFALMMMFSGISSAQGTICFDANKALACSCTTFKSDGNRVSLLEMTKLGGRVAPSGEQSQNLIHTVGEQFASPESCRTTLQALQTAGICPAR